MKILSFFFFFLLGVCIYITYQIKNCVCIYVCIYIIKKNVCIYMCGGCLDKYINAATWLPKIKIPRISPRWKILLWVGYIKHLSHNIRRSYTSIGHMWQRCLIRLFYEIPSPFSSQTTLDTHVTHSSLIKGPETGRWFYYLPVTSITC